MEHHLYVLFEEGTLRSEVAGAWCALRLRRAAGARCCRGAPWTSRVRVCARGLVWRVHTCNRVHCRTALRGTVRLPYSTGISSHASWSCFIHLDKNTIPICNENPEVSTTHHLSMAVKRASALAAHTYYLASPLAAPPHELPDLQPDLLAIWVATLPLVLQLCPALLAPLRP